MHTQKGLVVIEDSKRNDIGNTAKAYANAHLSKEGVINADFMTVSPFLGTDSIQPFLDVAEKNEKGVFVLVKTSNPSSVEISEAKNENGEKISDWLAGYISSVGQNYLGKSGYSAVGVSGWRNVSRRSKTIKKNNAQSLFSCPRFWCAGRERKRYYFLLQ